MTHSIMSVHPFAPSEQPFAPSEHPFAPSEKAFAPSKQPLKYTVELNGAEQCYLFNGMLFYDQPNSRLLVLEPNLFNNLNV
jgi:hypothetical protein